MTKINTEWYKARPISQIKLKHRELEKILKDNLGDVLGFILEGLMELIFKKKIMIRFQKDYNHY